jgi:hypothetical protein
MATFPTLKTGAVAQYPATRRLRFQNQAVRFVDGTEQRYRDSAGALRRWEIALELLDESEVAAVENFFVDVNGTAGVFAFTDPWDGQVYASCSVETDWVESTAQGEMRGVTRLAVVENRV